MFRLPSLQSLKIFECAARHASFTNAADELGVSQGAVSQHIKNLEIRVGFEVFIRSGRAISLSSSGQLLLESVIHGLTGIQRTIEHERRKQLSNELIISVLPGFAIRWLFPRLMAFNAQHPKIKISLNTVAKPLDFDLYHAHAAIAYAPLEGRHSNRKPLFSEHLFPVCSAGFAKRHHINTDSNKSHENLADLLTLPLLGDESPTAASFRDTWSYWLEKTRLQRPLKPIDCQSQSNMTLQLAELGHGIAIGRTSLVQDALKKGDLIALTPPTILNPSHYFICENPAVNASQSLSVFSEWLNKECQSINITE